ncbi:SDR family NAD(P)-dependent oxidoreductase [Bradyrhizobium yuanmingense]|nr:SDR family NAD(P)-dependent oxidoreductase [Bradyrhizobium yuanmingense]MDF0585088.1 SDR family NAD(P)-dependent oxidoreductase [Bradyrhizobium yuanmingense]
MTHCYDAEDAKSPISWVNATVARWGGVDAMVNAAGINPTVRISDEGENELDEMWRVNVKGPLRLVRAPSPIWPSAVMAGSLIWDRELASGSEATLVTR